MLCLFALFERRWGEENPHAPPPHVHPAALTALTPFQARGQALSSV